MLTLAGEGGIREVSATGSTLSLSLSPMLMPMLLREIGVAAKEGAVKTKLGCDGVNDITWASPSVAYEVAPHSTREHPGDPGLKLLDAPDIVMREHMGTPPM